MSAMRRALVATGVALALLLVGPVRARAQQAAPAETDSWFGHDKALHFAASGSPAGGGDAGASLAPARRPPDRVRDRPGDRPPMATVDESAQKSGYRSMTSGVPTRMSPLELKKTGA